MYIVLGGFVIVMVILFVVFGVINMIDSKWGMVIDRCFFNFMFYFFKMFIIFLCFGFYY